MIKIIYNSTTKCPGINSLYITIPYDELLISIIKNSDCAIYNKNKKEWEVCESALPQLLDQFTLIDDIEIEDKTQQISITNYEPQLQYKTKPFNYQMDGIKYGLNHNKWMLLDAPGLGKTLQVIYIAEELKKLYNIKHCLIICGISTLKQNWKNEIKKHSNLDCTILGEKTNTKGKTSIGSVSDRLAQLSKKINEFFIITNIETIRNTDIVRQINNGINAPEMIILDEAHTCKNSQSQQGKNLLKLKNAKYKIALTGTLIMNSPIDAYSALKWLGAERCNLSTFKHYYLKYGGLFNNEIIGYKNISYLKKQIAAYSLRRTKELLNLPEKTIINEIVEMEPSQLEFYNNIVEGVVDQLDLIELDNNAVLALATRLRQATASPSMLTSQNIPSSKLQRLVDLSEQIIQNNDKVVVFSVFKEPLDKIAVELKEYCPLICSGDIPDDIIADNIKKFQNDNKYKLLLCTTSKMGTGVTLTAASYMIFLDTPWTSALCEQCEDRIHRIGSENPVFIYYLWTNNTFDMQVKQIIEDKSILEDYIVDNKINSNFIERLKKLILDLKIS